MTTSLDPAEMQSCNSGKWGCGRSIVKAQWTYTLREEKRRTTMVGDKKHIVVVQNL